MAAAGVGAAGIEADFDSLEQGEGECAAAAEEERAEGCQLPHWPLLRESQNS